ncbi:general transcription factor IIF subunit 1 isoform X3 [Clupea harengus]|uniref:Transcription initiation factor IIF subunit alpha n=1 Tax=Clupea harengus TaxID=7950 RepID=A0A6P8EZK5_CLUHA|nr:general transcription factor IIF subunit 1 isoform X3 [Clupea harengus]
MASLGGSSSGTEYTVRVPKNTNKKYNIMAFNAGDKVNCSAWTQARMERDMSNRRMYAGEESEEGAAGSEFGKKQREEARRKKYGIVTREFKVDDQPWILKVNGKAGKRFKGQKKGGVTENASYYIFTQCPDGAFEAFPVHGWYNFVPQAKHRTLTAEEAEEEWGRRNKVVNHFSIMLQRRLRESDRGGAGDDDDDDDEGGKGGKKKKKKGGRGGGDLRITDLEDDLEMSSDESGSSAGEDGEGKPKTKKKAKGKGKKKKKNDSDKSHGEDSDDGDFEGLEVDYISDETSSEEEDAEKAKPNKGQDVPKGIDEMSESEEESEEEKPNEEETKEEEEEDEGKKTPVHMEKKKKKGVVDVPHQRKEPNKNSSGESESSEDSDIDGEATSALFMVKKRTPPKRSGGRGSAGSSKTGSRPGTPSIDSAATSSTLRAAASKLEQGKGKRQPAAASADTPASKRLKMDPSPQSPSGKSTPQPSSGKSTPSASDVQLTEEAVRRYLIRKPMTTKDLLKKFQTKRTGLSSDQTVNVLAQILKKLNPERKNINDKMHFYLTE